MDGAEHGQEPIVYELLRLWREHKIKPAPVRLGELPDHATTAMRAVADDMRLRFGLMLAEGVTRALLYATCEPVKAGLVSARSSASYVLRRLEEERVVCCIGEAPKRGRGNGTRLWVPPGWRPADPLAIERAGEHGLADLVWIPDEPELVRAAVEPGTELANELVVVDGVHASEPSSIDHGFSRPSRRIEHAAERFERIHSHDGRAER